MISGMKKLILISALLLVASNGWAYNETDLAKFKALNACVGCDLSGADLSQADLKNTDLTTTNLRYAKLDGAKYCKTKMPCVQSSTFRALAGPLNDPVLRWT